MNLYYDLNAALDAACRKANATKRRQALMSAYAGVGYRVVNADWASRYGKRVLETCRPQEVAA